MRRLAAVVLLVGLAGCGSNGRPSDDAVRQRERAAIAKMDARVLAGRYAPSPAACEGDWWDFASNQIDTADDLHCLVQDNTPAADFKTLVLACVDKGVTANERWTVRFPSEDQLSIRRDGAPAIELTRCRDAYSTVR